MEEGWRSCRRTRRLRARQSVCFFVIIIPTSDHITALAAQGASEMFSRRKAVLTLVGARSRSLSTLRHLARSSIYCEYATTVLIFICIVVFSLQGYLPLYDPYAISYCCVRIQVVMAKQRKYGRCSDVRYHCLCRCLDFLPCRTRRLSTDQSRRLFTVVANLRGKRLKE